MKPITYLKHLLLVFLLIPQCGCSSQKKLLATQDVLKSGFRSQLALTKQYPEIENREVKLYLAYLIKRLQTSLPHQSSQPQEVVVHVLKTDKIMALSPINGVIDISLGLLRILQTESELAFVLAHEMSHQQLGHLSANLSDFDRALHTETQNQFELEADKHALLIVVQAGYDPWAATQALSHTYTQFEHQNPNGHQVKDQVISRLLKLQRLIRESGWQAPGTIDRRDYRRIRRFLGAELN